MDTEKKIVKLNKKYQKLRNLTKKVHIKNQIRLEQNKRDHNFIYLFKEMFPEEYTKIVEEYKKKFPNLLKLDVLKKTIYKKSHLPKGYKETKK